MKDNHCWYIILCSSRIFKYFHFFTVEIILSTCRQSILCLFHNTLFLILNIYLFKILFTITHDAVMNFFYIFDYLNRFWEVKLLGQNYENTIFLIPTVHKIVCHTSALSCSWLFLFPYFYETNIIVVILIWLR